MLRAASATPLGPRVDCVPVTDVLAERDVVTQLRERVIHVHVLSVTANFPRKPSLEGKDGSRVIDRKVEDLSRWQPTGVDGSCAELHIVQHLVQSKWWLLRGRSGCWLRSVERRPRMCRGNVRWRGLGSLCRRFCCCWGCRQRIGLGADQQAQI